LVLAARPRGEPAAVSPRAPNQDFVLGSVPKDQAGTAGAALITAQRIGQRCSAAEAAAAAAPR
jgi:hypothetical protein